MEVNTCYKCKAPSHKGNGDAFNCRNCKKLTPSIALRDRVRAALAECMKKLADNPELIQQLKRPGQ